MRLKARVGKAESQIMAEFDQEYQAWLHGLPEEQYSSLLDALLSRLAREGLGPDLHGQSLGELPGEEADEALDQAQEMQARDKPRAGQLIHILAPGLGLLSCQTVEPVNKGLLLCDLQGYPLLHP